jgi:colicin import membrane protein
MLDAMRHTTIVFVRASKKPSKAKPKKKRTSRAHNPPAPEVSKPKRSKKPSPPPVDPGPPGRSGWRELYETTCGPERDELRKKAGATNATSRAAVAAAVKADRAAARKAAREAAAAAARPAKRVKKLKTQTAKVAAAAEAPCDHAKRELIRRTERDKRRRSEKRTPKQREAGRRSLVRLREEIEAAANDVEAEINYREPGRGIGPSARRAFIQGGARYVSGARAATASHPGSRTTPAELFLEWFEAHKEELLKKWSKDAVKTDAEYSADEEAYYRSLEEDDEDP